MTFRKKIVLILFFLSFPFYLFAHYSTDSLENCLLNANSDKEKLSIYIELSWIYRRVAPVKSVDYGFKALKIAQEKRLLKEELKSKSYIGVALRSANYYTEALEYFNEALESARNENLQVEIGFAHINIGYTYFLQKRYDLAKEYLLKASKIADVADTLILKDYSYDYLIDLYYETGEYHKALEWCKRIEPVKLAGDNQKRIGILYYKYGDVYLKLENYKNALNEYQNSLSFLEEDTLQTNIALSKIAGLYYKTKKLEKSKTLFLEIADNICHKKSSGFERKDYIDLRIEVYSYLVKIFMERKNYKQVSNFQSEILKAEEEILNDNTVKQIISANMQKRLQEIELEKHKLEISKQRQEQAIQKNRFIIWGIFIISVLLTIFIFILYRERMKLKQTNIVLREQRKSLEELNATKDKFFSIIAHDLKNPFHALLGFTELLNDSIEDEDIEEIKSISGYVTETINSAYKLLENLLNWSRSQRGAVKYNPKILSLSDLLHNVKLLVQAELVQKSILLKALVEPSDKVYADKEMMKTILRNLITNAVKFSYENSSIIVKTSKLDHYLKISIIDFGVGINPENEKSLFDVASNNSTVGTNGEKGTGIGLPLCKEFVEKNGGKIGFQSSKDKGTEFWILVPTSSRS